MTKLILAMAAPLLAGALTFGAGACGSGGSDGPTAVPNAFFGTYWMAGFTGRNAAPDEGSAQWGTYTSNGLGMAGADLLTSNADGLVGPPMPGGNFESYSLDANGRLSLVDNGVVLATGGVASDGSAANLGLTFAPFPPTLLALCRQGGTFTVTSLSGLYHFVLFAYDTPNTDDIARWGTMTFNSGVITVNRMNNVSGAVGSTLPFAANYFVAGNGQVDLTMDGESFRGGVQEGGSFAVLGGATASGGKPTLLILVKGSTTASIATFSGTYHAAGIEAPVGGTPEWSGYTTTADADGSGGLTINAGQRNDDGTVSALAPMTTTYTVALDGTLSISGGDVIGGVSPTGRYVIFGGSTVPAQGPLLWFLFR